ncbi:hypothetical protein AB0D97_24965 [Streptomyces roseus]|uniref:hypothetical protein n=1 Tax=Streptomyces roseus TaxID=66430 RepID=UPI0033DEF1AC
MAVLHRHLDASELHDRLRFHYPRIEPTDTIAVDLLLSLVQAYEERYPARTGAAPPTG